MYCTYTIILLFFMQSVTLGLRTKKSFAIILDTTLSMQEEIDVVKRNIGAVLSSVDLRVFENFIVVTFKDPDVGSPQIFSTPSGLVSSINNVTVSGGRDCPENSLAGIKKALEDSKLESYIFVFTDAYANDYSKLDEVKNLCQSTKSQVVIFLSGSCLSTNGEGHDDNINVYFEVAKSCKGSVIQLEPANLRQAFSFMKGMIETDWSEVKIIDPLGNNADFRLSVDDSTSMIMIAMQGNLTNPNLQIRDQHGDIKVERIIATTTALVVRLKYPNPGNYLFRINNRGHIWAAVFMKKNFPMQVGFSIRQPQSMKETSSRPLPDRKTYIFIALPSDTTIKLLSADLLNLDTNERSYLNLAEHSERQAHYITSAVFNHDHAFQIIVEGQDTSNNRDVTKSTRVFEAQEASGVGVKRVPESKPRVEIIPPMNTLVDFGGSLRVACKVTGFPQSDVDWKFENGDLISSEDVLVEIPDIFVSYVTISNLRRNATISCKAINSHGEDTHTLDLFVKKNFVFEVKQMPKDETVEFGAEGRLYCEIEAFPTATIRWYHNDTRLSEEVSENVELSSHNQMLLIKKMSIQDTGEYKCEVTHQYENQTFTATVDISGLESPRIETPLERAQRNINLGEWIELECIATGKPAPDIKWKHKSNDANEFSSLPDGVYFENGKIKIPSIKMEHSGVYRCEASNILGQDGRDITVEIQYPPVIKNTQNTLTVREGNIVELNCEVDAVPAARVYWEMCQDDVIVPFDSRHTTVEHNTHRFEALWKDYGNYHCIAENAIGKSEKIVTVHVLVAPYIQPPQHKNITAKIGSSLSLACNILFGNPLPSTKWEFISLDYSRMVLLRGNTSRNDLSLINISKNNEGSYICIAENDVGSDSIKISLRVQ